MSETDLVSTAAPAKRKGLSGMVLAELRQLAGELDIPGTAGMRKGDLIAAIKERQAGGPASPQLALGDGATDDTAGATTGSRPARGRGSAAAAADAPAVPAAESPAAAQASDTAAPETTAAETPSAGATAPVTEAPPAEKPVRTRRRAASRPAGAPARTPAVEAPSVAEAATGADAASVAEAPAVEAPAAGSTSAGSTSAGNSAAGSTAVGETAAVTEIAAITETAAAAEPARAAAPSADAADAEPETTGRRRQTRRRGGDQADGGQAADAGTDVRDRAAERTNGVERAGAGDGRGERRGRDNDRRDRRDDDRRDDRRDNDRGDDRGGRNSQRGNDSRGNDSRAGDGRNNDGRNNDGRGNDQRGVDTRGNDSRDDDGDDDGDGRGRRGRRFRDRRRGRDRQGGGQGNVDTEVRDDDVLLPVAGIVDILDNYAFVRTTGYLSGPNDVYVSLSMVRKYGLRRGDAITGAVRQPREGEQQRQKFNPLVRVDTVNGRDPEAAKARPEFTKLTPLYPNERLRLETEPSKLTTRVIDLVMPVGKGQRALIVSPPKAGKTMVLQSIANAITTNNPEVHLMVVLVDERPEEVTDMQRSVKGEVIASTFDRPPSDHTAVAELAIERAKRLVEMGHDVVVLLDSITRLGRAYNLAAPASGRILSGGVDSTALYPPKRFLGAARNIEDGGSLTIFATALVETGSTMDTVIFEEFKGTGNAELKLDRKIADKRVFPAIDVDASGTRKEELLMSPDEFAVTVKLRRVLAALDDQQAIDLVLDRLRKTRTNIEFLMTVAKSTPGPDND
ncbi:transcription termination factor Rho [Pseudonocardia sp. D17]|uniref:transcription termination factor Rho n=1 Tax=Pseudonocardia sp. D17 TaxID=882661 RepID=UPI0030CB5E03|nr:hypothetical protein PSD17_40560 [Pseudonocardia sp. D17]